MEDYSYEVAVKRYKEGKELYHTDIWQLWPANDAQSAWARIYQIECVMGCHHCPTNEDFEKTGSCQCLNEHCNIWWALKALEEYIQNHEI